MSRNFPFLIPLPEGAVLRLYNPQSAISRELSPLLVLWNSVLCFPHSLSPLYSPPPLAVARYSFGNVDLKIEAWSKPDCRNVILWHLDIVKILETWCENTLAQEKK